MTKKRKRYPDLNQKLERPWCYYCERDFDDLKILISHQKAKHFKCDRCGRRLNTAGGLSVHMNQVHKENLTHVENANPGRQGLDVEIFGMEGVPADIIEQHVQEVTQIHFAEEAERARITGNPVRGPYANGAAPPNKRPRVVETLEEIEKRAKQFRHDKQNGIIPAVAAPAVQEIVPDAVAPPIMPPQHSPFGAAPFAYPPPNGPPPPGMPQTGALPPRPSSSAPPDAIQSSIDDLIAGVQKEVPEKKSKKEKNMRLIYNDENISPEEKMAALPRFADFMRT